MVQKIDTFKMPEQLVNGPRTIEVNERPSSQDNFGRQIPDQQINSEYVEPADKSGLSLRRMASSRRHTHNT